MHPVTDAPVIYSNDSSPEASGTLQFDKVCIKRPSHHHKIHSYYSSSVQNIYLNAIEIQCYCQNLTTENLPFTVGENNNFSSSINHGKLRNIDVKLSVSKSSSISLEYYSARVFPPPGT